MSDERLVNWLFETNAVRVCPEGKPFWYTSGTIGPYYINTHFLYGSEKRALELLETIDAVKADRINCPGRLFPVLEANYDSDVIYRGLIDSMIDFIGNNMNVDNIDYVSGGERRDWFFSLLVSKGLGKPHITLYKDLSAVVTENGETTTVDTINGARVLHIADLITEASSYERAWIPAINNICGQMTESVVVVDRLQGGSELLEKNEVCSFAMVSINKSFFDKALELRHIDIGQYNMLMSYTADPHSSMKAFLTGHPEFLQDALKADARTRERAQLCIEKKIYN